MASRPKYVLVKYGRNTLLCRPMAGSKTLTAIARFDHESEAQTVLERCNAGDETGALTDAAGQSRRLAVAR